MKRRVEILFVVILVLLFAFAVFEARKWHLYARLFPWMIGFPMIVLALWQLVLTLVSKERAEGGKTEAEGALSVSDRLARLRTFFAVAWLLGLLLAILLLGFSLSVILFTLLYLKVESKEKWWLTVLLSAFAWVFFYLFNWAVNLPFPEGLLFQWLS